MVFSWGDGDFGKLGRGGSEGESFNHLCLEILDFEYLLKTCKPSQIYEYLIESCSAYLIDIGYTWIY